MPYRQMLQALRCQGVDLSTVPLSSTYRHRGGASCVLPVLYLCFLAVIQDNFHLVHFSTTNTITLQFIIDFLFILGDDG